LGVEVVFGDALEGFPQTAQVLQSLALAVVADVVGGRLGAQQAVARVLLN
jgi:hypothetical protein